MIDAQKQRDEAWEKLRRIREAVTRALANCDALISHADTVPAGALLDAAYVTPAAEALDDLRAMLRAIGGER